MGPLEVLAIIFAILLAAVIFVMYRIWQGLKKTYTTTNDPVPIDMIAAQVIVTFSATIFPALGLGYTLYRIIF